MQKIKPPMYFHTIEGFAKSGGRFRGRNFYL